MSDAILRSPHIQTTSNQSAVTALLKYVVGHDGQARHGLHITGRNREGSALLYVKDLDNRNVAGLRAINERLKL